MGASHSDHQNVPGCAVANTCACACAPLCPDTYAPTYTHAHKLALQNTDLDELVATGFPYSNCPYCILNPT